MGQLDQYDLRTQRACGRDIDEAAIEEEERRWEDGQRGSNAQGYVRTSKACLRIIAKVGRDLHSRRMC